MRVLMTGATGFIGQKLGQRLVQQGHQLAMLTRNPKRARQSLPFPCEIYPWNPEHSGDLKTLQGALEGVHGVFHLAGEPVVGKRWDPAQKQKILSSRVKSSHELVQAIKGLTGSVRPQVFISASATGFYGDRADEILTESSNPGDDFLASVCCQWESEAFSLGVPQTRVVALRTGIVLGHEGGTLPRLLPLFRIGVGGRLGNGTQWMSWIHIEDLVSLYCYCLENAVLQGPVNGVSPEPVTNMEFTHTLAKSVHRPAFLPVPKFALRLAMGEVSEIIFSSQRVLPKKALEAGFMFKFPSLESACQDLLK